MKTFILLLAVFVAVNCADVGKYLEQYGYYNPNSFAPSNLENSIKEYQSTFNLPVTGIVDDATKGLMNTPRCGVSDHGGNTFSYGDSKYANKFNFTYYFKNFSPDLSQQQIRDLTKKALKMWSDVSRLTFQEKQGSGDVQINFGVRNTHKLRDRNCPYPFDGPGGVIAHAFFPPNGDMHYDDDELFTTGTSRGRNFLFVTVHEFGHILGLQHDTQDRSSIMFPYIQSYDPNMKLGPYDITRIQYLYGKNTKNPSPSPSSAPTDAPSSAPTDAPTEAPPACKDHRTTSYCHSRYKYCRDYSTDWTNYLKRYCYKTCNYC